MAKKRMRIIRQGDVLLYRLSRPPRETAVLVQAQREDGQVVLAHGEVTGHKHAIPQEAANMFVENAGTTHEQTLLRIEGPATLMHEEHNPIEVPKGWWKVVRQREYSPGATRAQSYVAD